MPVELTQKPSDIQLNDYQEIDQILGNPPRALFLLPLLFLA